MCSFDKERMLRRFMLLSAVPFLMGTTALASTVLYDNGAINGTQGTGAPTISSWRGIAIRSFCRARRSSPELRMSGSGWIMAVRRPP